MSLVFALRGAAAVMVLATFAGGLPTVVRVGLAIAAGLWTSVIAAGPVPDDVAVWAVAARELVIGATLGILAAVPLLAAQTAGKLVDRASPLRDGPYAAVFGLLGAAVFAHHVLDMRAIDELRFALLAACIALYNVVAWAFFRRYRDPAARPRVLPFLLAVTYGAVLCDFLALTALEQRGFQVFNNRGGCTQCHRGPLFTDNRFLNIGVRPILEDRGRAVVTNQPRDEGAFKVPGLRNVGLRAPYFHNGGMATLEEVVDFYDRGGDHHVNQSPQIVPLGLTSEEKTALVAFLEKT